jgi:hypothetical protein
MAEQQSIPDTIEDAGNGGGSTRWQTVVGIIGLLVRLSVGNQIVGLATAPDVPAGEPVSDVADDDGHDPSQWDH